VDGYVLAPGVENLALWQNASVRAATGNALGNLIIGNVYTNLLCGGAGDDTIDGANGDNTIDGGDGLDYYVNSSAPPTQRLVRQGDEILVVSDIAGDPVETLRNIERIDRGGVNGTLRTALDIDGHAGEAIASTGPPSTANPTSAASATRCTISISA
jgi:hypothetical protein